MSRTSKTTTTTTQIGRKWLTPKQIKTALVLSTAIAHAIALSFPQVRALRSIATSVSAITGVVLAHYEARRLPNQTIIDVNIGVKE